MEEHPHLTEKCPGKAYWDKKDKTLKEDIRTIFKDVVGDVPKHMKIAADNRIWLWLLTSLVFVDTGMIILCLIIVSHLNS